MSPILDKQLFAEYRSRRRARLLPLLALAAVIFAASGVAALQTVGGGGELSDLALRARGFFDPLAQPAALSAAAAEVEGTSTAAYAENGFSETPAAQEIAAATSSPQQPVVYQQTIEQPVVEKIMYEAPTSSAVTEGEFDAALGALETQINQLSLQNSAELVGAYQAASYVPAQTSGASSGSGSSSVDWGDISGTLSNQSDLQNALDQELALADWYATTSAPQLTTLANLSLPYAQVTGAPTVPTTTSDLINDSGFVTSSFSTTSADFWQSQTNFFSTSSASYFLNQDQTSAFSTSSASYFLAQNQPLAFSTTSASYFLAQNQTSSSTSTIGYLTATTTNATSTFAGGLAAGVSGLVYNWATGFTGVGTANPARLFTVFGASGNPQERISYSGSAYTELQTDAAGDFLIAPTSGIMEISSGNLEVCSNDVCATPTVALSGEGNLTVDNRLVAGSLEEACPSGYIWVPGDDKYGTLPGFCTMKYDASDSGGTAVSSASGVPWVSISQTSAIAQCDALGPGYHLMSDEEWMTIADETTALPINDMTGSQDFATGMSDSYVSSAQSAGDSGTDPVVSGCNFMEPLSNSANAYVADSCEERGDGTGGTTDADKGFYATGSDFTSPSYSAGAAGPAQLRTRILPDGAVIWDFGGNVLDWTDATIYESNSSGASASSEEPDAGSWSGANWYQYTSITDYKGLNYIRPDITTWNSTNGIGEIYLNTGTGYFAFVRGGAWTGGSIDGPFALNLYIAPSNTFSGVGFRCSYSAP